MWQLRPKEDFLCLSICRCIYGRHRRRCTRWRTEESVRRAVRDIQGHRFRSSINLSRENIKNRI